VAVITAFCNNRFNFLCPEQTITHVVGFDAVKIGKKSNFSRKRATISVNHLSGLL
jgi:hypothetical protein